MKGKLFLVTLSLIMIIAPFWFKDYQLLRLALALMGLILLTLALFLNKKKNVFKMTIVFLSFFSELFLIDYLLVSFLELPPILAIKVTSSKDVSTYNSLLYRVYNCQDNQILDHFYRSVYACNVILDETSINTISNEILNNYGKYREKFFNIQGKISKIQGTNILELQGYEQTDNKLNGHVAFKDHITVQVDLGNRYDLSDYKIYDSVNIIGRIASKSKKNNTTYIYVKDAILLETDLYKTYELVFDKASECTNNLNIISKTDEYNFYSQCLNNMYIKYDEENIYELSYVLTDHRMTFKKMIEKAIVTEKDGLTLYETDKLNILKCQTNNVILGDKSLTLNSNVCEEFDAKKLEDAID